MKIKTFDFPSFKLWNMTQKYSQKIGDYTCSIEPFSYSHDKHSKNTYVAVIANSDYPMNIHVQPIFKDYICCNATNKVALENWYKAIIITLNVKWQVFISQKYLYEN